MMIEFGLDCSDSIPGRDKTFFRPAPLPDRLWEPCNVYQGLHPAGVKRLGRETDPSLLSSAKTKNVWSFVPLPHTSSWHGALSQEHVPVLKSIGLLVRLFRFVGYFTTLDHMLSMVDCLVNGELTRV
jgi:hypothetical protein